ncbi:MAG: hypothetical protein H6R19_3478, partial [Proteobacteria bacterium]|nr:hypothetical protein [Pseudomonadota bacterium]
QPIPGKGKVADCLARLLANTAGAALQRLPRIDRNAA